MWWHRDDSQQEPPGRRMVEPSQIRVRPEVPSSRSVSPPAPAPGNDGSFIVDRAGNLLAFDRAMERLTGWHAGEVVGRHKDMGIYAGADENGDRRYDPRPLYEGSLPEVARSSRTTLLLNGKQGGQLEVQAVIAPSGGADQRFTVQIQNVLARMNTPVPEVSDSVLDPSTRLPKAEMFLETLRQGLERIQLFGGPLSVLLVDIDHYPNLEKRLGKKRAEETLRRLAGILRATLRGSDVIGRMEVDHFAVMLDQAGRSDARHVAGRIRQTVESFSFAAPGSGESLNLTVSIGAACHPADGASTDELLTRAHSALEEAHRLGRNRVWCYARRPRVAVALPVAYEGPTASVLGTMLDLSNSGAFVQTREMLPTGMRVGLVVRLPDQKGSMHLIVRIVRQVPVPLDVNHPAGLGVEFETLAKEQIHRIDAFISHIQEGCGV